MATQSHTNLSHSRLAFTVKQDIARYILLDYLLWCELFVVVVHVCSHASELKVRLHLNTLLSRKPRLNSSCILPSLFWSLQKPNKKEMVDIWRRENGFPPKCKTSTGNKFDFQLLSLSQKSALLKIPSRDIQVSMGFYYTQLYHHRA